MWRRGSSVTAEELFSAAFSMPASERELFLERACGEDHEQRARVGSLLNSICAAGEFVREQHEPYIATSASELIGDYRLLQELGEGGGGTVYLAEQLAPVRREVALKIIKAGMDTRAVINRFEAERQALAMMDHPNIAKVFDAGATRAGRPYFVMELVRGIRITEYCTYCSLSIRERLALFMQVCNAIEHAHRKGVVHRDVKPSNVLVTLCGGIAITKVIDFGVAKATQGRLTEDTLFTRVDEFIGTPAYVSPEQTGLDSSNVDARSDIYSLGVLLYELLTGCTPLDPNELSGLTLEEVRKRIRDETPLLPSRRLQALHGNAINEALLRHLSKQISGDLDWIAMRCLEKDRARRYRSASDLAADLERYMQDEPVLARPPGLIYGFRKFARRHRAVVTTVSITMSALLIATGVSTWQAIRATRAEKLSLQDRERAEDVSQFLLDVFSAADPFINFGHEPTARTLLDQAARNIEYDLTQQSEVRARLLETIGRSYRRMGQPDRAVIYLTDALEIKLRAGANDASVGTIVTELAIALRDEGRMDEADKYFSQAREISGRLKGDGSEAHAKLLIDLSRLENMRGRTKQALDYANDALRLMRSLKGSEDPEVGAILIDMSSIMLWSDDLQGAEDVAREAVRVFRAVPTGYPDRAMADRSLGDVLFHRGQLDEAALLLERARETQQQLFGSTNSIVAETLGSLAQVRLAQGNAVEAEKLIVEALATHRTSKSTAYLNIGYLETVLATIWIHTRKYANAEALLRGTRELFVEQVPRDHQYLASTEYYLGVALSAQRKFAEAAEVLTASIGRWQRNNASRWRTARSASALGETLYELGRTEDAEHHLVHSYRVLISEPGADEDAKEMARQRVTRFYSDRGQREKLDSLLLEGKQRNVLPPAEPSPRAAMRTRT